MDTTMAQDSELNSQQNQNTNQLSSDQIDEAKSAAKRKLLSMKKDRLRQNDMDRGEQLLFLLKQARQTESGQAPSSPKKNP